MRAGLLVLLFTAAAAAQPAPVVNPDAAPTAYVGGMWWDGDSFTPRDTTWAERGVFVEGPVAAERVVELGDRFVVPPFGDAHTHMLSDAWTGPSQAEQFVEEGVFYAMVITDRFSWASQVMDRFDGPGTVDVIYSHGGWTSPRSHPVQVYEWQALRYVGRELTDAMKREIDASRLAADDAYFEAPTLEAVAETWPTFLAHEPDVVKVYLLDAAAVGPARSGMTGAPTGRGLSPDVLRDVIRRAHAAGLRVFAHVQTAADVALAVDAGVDGFAHLPGYRWEYGSDAPYLLDAATVAEAARRGVVFVPTSVVGVGYGEGRPARDAVFRSLHRRLVRQLHGAGVSLALGADQWGQTSRAEADFWVDNGFLPPATVLDLWTRATPQVVFPGRAVGRLAPGYEASLLALDCDPVAAWACTERISHREKQGLDLGQDGGIAGAE